MNAGVTICEFTHLREKTTDFITFCYLKPSSVSYAKRKTTVAAVVCKKEPGAKTDRYIIWPTHSLCRHSEVK